MYCQIESNHRYLPVMSEMSESEKRRILRERRQKKFSSGGGSSRLNRITGQADSLLSTESSLDSRKRIPEANPENTDNGLKHENSSRSDDKTPEKSNPEISLLKQLAGQDQEGINDQSPDLMSMFQSMQGGATTGPNLGQQASPMGQEMVDYHNYLVNRLKAWTILAKWIILLPYIYLATHCVDLKLPAWLLDSSNFFSVFVGFEIVATSAYYSRLRSIEKNTSINTIVQNSMIAQVISLIPEQGPQQWNLKSYLLTLLQYWDVVSMLLTDICFVLIVLGIFSYV